MNARVARSGLNEIVRVLEEKLLTVQRLSGHVKIDGPSQTVPAMREEFRWAKASDGKKTLLFKKKKKLQAEGILPTTCVHLKSRGINQVLPEHGSAVHVRIVECSG